MNGNYDVQTTDFSCSVLMNYEQHLDLVEDDDYYTPSQILISLPRPSFPRLLFTHPLILLILVSFADLTFSAVPSSPRNTLPFSLFFVISAHWE